MGDVGIALKRPSTLPLAIMEFIIVTIEAVMKVEVDICIKRQATLPLALLDQ